MSFIKNIWLQQTDILFHTVPGAHICAAAYINLNTNENIACVLFFAPSFLLQLKHHVQHWLSVRDDSVILNAIYLTEK